MMGPLIDRRVEAVAGRPYESRSEPARLPVLPVYHLIVAGRYEAHSGREAQSLAYLNLPRVNAFIGGAGQGGTVSNVNTNWVRKINPYIWATSVSIPADQGVLWAGWWNPNTSTYMWQGPIRSALYDHALTDAEATEIARRLAASI